MRRKVFPSVTITDYSRGGKTSMRSLGEKLYSRIERRIVIERYIWKYNKINIE